MERMTSCLLRLYNQKEHFYSTPEYQEHKAMFDFYKKNQDELINLVGYRPDSFITMDYWTWYLMVTREFEKFYFNKGINKEKVFEFLDNLEEPYKHIFFPFWEINTYAYQKGYYPYQVKGVDKIAIFIASEYAKYKVYKKIIDYGNKA